MKGCRASELPSYLDEFMWRERFRRTRRVSDSVLRTFARTSPLSIQFNVRLISPQSNFRSAMQHLTLSGRQILLNISRVDGGWVWLVQSQEWKVEFFVPQAMPLIRSGGGRRVPWRRQCGRYPWASPNLYGSGFSIAVGVVLTATFTAADRSPKASRNDLV